ncbi:MAG: hypothetical protein K1X51_13365 [Rhodospirillaceae bacterium]|nr:hypothetical protein [Rhodospirillaceae bacterium]
MIDTPEVSAPAAPAGPRNTHFDFQAKVFQAPGACFMLKGRDKQPMFVVEISGGQGIVSLADLRKAFSIAPGSPDDKLIDRAAAGLQFVPDIKPGDEIPNELLDGSASWTVARRHKQIARDKLQVQLLSWMSGAQVSYASQDDLKKILDSDENKKALKDAFGKAAVALGYKANESEQVLDRIETLARELCYIEALRERAQEVVKIQQNLEALAKVYGGDLKVSADIGRMKILIVKGAHELRDILDNVDAETADVLGALMSIDAVIKSVRKARDELHYILMEWDPVMAKWQNLNMVKSQEIDRALAATYQFLAQRFSTGKSMMKSKSRAAVSAPKAYSGLKTPEDDKEKGPKPYAGLKLPEDSKEKGPKAYSGLKTPK